MYFPRHHRRDRVRRMRALGSTRVRNRTPSAAGRRVDVRSRLACIPVSRDVVGAEGAVDRPRESGHAPLQSTVRVSFAVREGFVSVRRGDRVFIERRRAAQRSRRTTDRHVRGPGRARAEHGRRLSCPPHLKARRYGNPRDRCASRRGSPPKREKRTPSHDRPRKERGTPPRHEAGRRGDQG